MTLRLHHGRAAVTGRRMAAGLLLAALAGCQSVPEDKALSNVSMSPASLMSVQMPLSPAQKVAEALMAADMAFLRQDRGLLLQALGQLALRGPRPLEAGQEALLRKWTTAAGTALPPMRGRAAGPGFVDGMLEASAKRVFTQVLLSGEPTDIAVSAAPARFVGLKVFDGDDRLLCEREGVEQQACSVTPVFTQRFRIEVSNRGNERARYFMVID